MDNEFILITGATSNLGKILARILSENNRLILHGRDKNKLELLKENISNSEKHLIWISDFSLQNNISDIFLDFIVSNKIFLCGIIHVAGIADFKPARLINRNSIMDSFCINFFSILDIINVITKKQYKSYMKSIILISSVSVHSSTGKGMGAYISSKAAMEFYGKAIAAEIAPIRINSIALGGFESKKEDSVSKFIENANIIYPLGKGTAENVTGMVEYLLSDKSSWITGQTFIIDGGYSVYR